MYLRISYLILFRVLLIVSNKNLKFSQAGAWEQGNYIIPCFKAPTLEQNI